MSEAIKFYHASWSDEDLMKARGDGIVIDDGEALRYLHTHTDEFGKYDLWSRNPAPIDEAKQAAKDRLERIATAAMQGMLAHPKRYKPRPNDPSNWHEAIAKEAAELARALIAELDKDEA